LRDWTCEALLPAPLFISVITPGTLHGNDHVQLTIHPEYFALSSQHSAVPTKVKLRKQDAHPIAIICEKGQLTQLFKVKYLTKLGKIAKLARAEEVLLQMGDDSPLSMVFHLEGDQGICNIFLAPLLPECTGT